MERRISRFGVGPRISASAVAYACLAAVATYARPDMCLLRPLSHPAFVVIAAVLLAFGVPMWLAGVISAMRAYNRDKLVTTGVFALVRHPMYSAWILFNLPGLALLTRSWPFLLTPLVTYAVFKLLIHREDDYLQRRFGEAYREYRARVNEILPTLSRR